MNPNNTSYGSRPRDAGSRGGGSRGVGSRGAGPSRGAGGSGGAGPSGFVDYANQQPYIPQFEDPNAGYNAGYFFHPQFSLSGFPAHFSQPNFPTQYSQQAGPSGYNQDYNPNYNKDYNPDYNRGNTVYPDYSPREGAERSDSSDTHSLVLETQAVPSEQSAPDSPEEDQPKQTFENRAPKRKWTTEGEVTSVNAWIDESENAVTVQFWKSIERSFYQWLNVAPYRSHHQLSTKWKALMKKITKFNGIYNNLINNRPSGMNDVQLLQMVRSRYQQQEFPVFPHEDSWEILRHCRKWATVPLMSGSSSRSTKRTFIRLFRWSLWRWRYNEVEEDIPQPPRPIARNKAKKALKTNRGDTSTTHMYESWDKQCNEKMEYKVRKLELDKQLADIEQQKLQVQLDAIFELDLAFHTTSHDHVEGMELQRVLAKKTRLKAKHN